MSDLVGNPEDQNISQTGMYRHTAKEDGRPKYITNWDVQAYSQRRWKTKIYHKLGCTGIQPKKMEDQNISQTGMYRHTAKEDG